MRSVDSLTRAHWYFVGPGAVAHAKNDGMSASHVARLALEPDNRAVTSAASVQDGYIGMRSFRQRGALRCCESMNKFVTSFVKKTLASTIFEFVAIISRMLSTNLDRMASFPISRQPGTRSSRLAARKETRIPRSIDTSPILGK